MPSPASPRHTNGNAHTYGMPIGDEVFAGDTADVTTVDHIVDGVFALAQARRIATSEQPSDDWATTKLLQSAESNGHCRWTRRTKGPLNGRLTWLARLPQWQHPAASQSCRSALRQSASID